MILALQSTLLLNAAHSMPPITKQIRQYNPVGVLELELFRIVSISATPWVSLVVSLVSDTKKHLIVSNVGTSMKGPIIRQHRQHD